MRKNGKGITLIALVITIVVLIILATISINLVFGEDGIVARTQTGNEQYKKGEAREKLALVLADAQIEKNINKQYNQNEYLDEFILAKLPNAQVLDEIVIVNGYAFSIDRSVPKIGEYVGKEDTLAFPELTANISYANDYKTATITITAQETENGISKIEIIQAGFVLKTYTYENTKETITENYTAKQNGSYLIKVYGKLTTKENIRAEGLVAGIEYEPNGNTEYKKEHSLKVSVAEDIEKVKSIKYQWLQTTVEPEANTFTKTVENGGTVAENTLTGEYYLWTLLETESGKQIIERSEAFFFDNQGPTVSELKSTPVSETSFTLTATASDSNVGEISKYEFYVNGELKETKESTDITVSYIVTDASTGNTSCYVIVYDSLGNASEQKKVTGKTKLYTWSKWNAQATTRYSQAVGSILKGNFSASVNTGILGWAYNINFNTCTGTYSRGTYCYACYGYICTGYVYGMGTSTPYNGATYWCYLGSETSYGSTFRCWDVYRATANGTTTYSKGTTQYTDVTSTSSSEYPSNGRSGSYWYVYKGIY